jgi:hypothetical protein
MPSTTLADVIIIPDPGFGSVSGQIGLTGETFASGTVYGGGLGSNFASDGLYGLSILAGSNYYLEFYMYNFQNTNNFRLRYRSPNNSALADGETRTFDLQRTSGRISPIVAVTNGTLTNVRLDTFSTDPDSSGYFWGYLAPTADLNNLVVPMPALANTRVSGYATVFSTAGGCQATMPLSNKYIDVAVGATTEVNWNLDASTINCDTGTLGGSIQLNGLDAGNNNDAVLSYFQVWASGPDFRNNYVYDGTYSMPDLKVGMYNVNALARFGAPYYYTEILKNSSVEVSKDATTTHDIINSAGTVHKSREVSGAWGILDTQQFWSYWNGPNGSLAIDLANGDGNLDFVMTPGDWTPHFNLFYFRTYELNNVTNRYFNQYQYFYYYPEKKGINVASGDRLDIAPEPVLKTSQSLVFLQLADEAKTISRVDISGYQIRDPYVGGENYYESSLYLSQYPSVDSSLASIMVRGIPGTYQISANVYTTEGFRFNVAFTLELGAPADTPTGTDVPVNLTDADGNTIANLTFAAVEIAGDTTVSETSSGPPAPSDYGVLTNNKGDGVYYDISTTATFNGDVQVCLSYDDTGLSLGQEKNIELGHFVCDANDQNCVWEIITDASYPDTDFNKVCGTTSSFSFFAPIIALDTDGDTVLDKDDNCKETPNPDQADSDTDGIGDVCEADTDGDGLIDDIDFCPDFASPNNDDLDGDEVGDVCDPDIDGDLIVNAVDNCPLHSNGGQDDFDGDGDGDACDTDDDGDVVEDSNDDCEGTALGQLVDDRGCSSSQLFNAICPTDAEYKNHGQYVSCVAHEAKRQVDDGLILMDEKGHIISSAAKSDIGKK